MAGQMDEAMEAIMKSRQIPEVPVNFVPATAGEIIKLGPITCRVLEDGSRTGRHEAQHPDAKAIWSCRSTNSEPSR
jgi:hypothetical protein